MNRLLGAAIAFAVILAVAEPAGAQVYQTYYAGPATAYYAPAPVTAYYAPAPVTTCCAPAPVTAYYAPAPTVAYYPTAVATTRYRPILGGTITRWRYVNRPAYAYPATVAYYPAW